MSSPRVHSRQKILLVEDMVDLARLYEDELTSQGYEVKTIYSGADAISCLQSQGRKDISLILLDLRLPDMDGIKLLDTLRSMNIQTPVIILTGYGSISSAISAMRHGARDFLLKPFEPEQLFESVRINLQASSQDNRDPARIKPLRQTEKDAIEAALLQTGGNIPKAAALLDVSPSTLYRKKAHWDKTDQ